MLALASFNSTAAGSLANPEVCLAQQPNLFNQKKFSRSPHPPFKTQSNRRKLCKITGRRMDDHNFVPLLEFGRRPQCVLCKVTGNGNVKKEMPKVCTVSSP